MAGNEEPPRLPQRRGRKAPGDLPDGFEPVVPLFRRKKAQERPEVSPPRPLPRSATPPPAPVTPAPPLPEPERVVAEPTPRGSSPSRLVAAGIALVVVLLVVLAIMLLG